MRNARSAISVNADAAAGSVPPVHLLGSKMSETTLPALSGVSNPNAFTRSTYRFARLHRIGPPVPLIAEEGPLAAAVTTSGVIVSALAAKNFRYASAFRFEARGVGFGP